LERSRSQGQVLLEGGVQERKEFDRAYATKAMLLFAGVAVTVLYVESMLTPALPSIAKEFNITSAQATLILSLYLVSGTALNPIIGKLGDMYGKKRMLMVILPIYAVMVSVTGFSPNYTFLVASRTVQGVGEGIFPLAMSMIREEFPREMIPKAQGLISAMFGIGAMVGIPVGALISNDFGWRTTYHTAIPVVVILTVLVFYYIRESRYRSRSGVKLDYIGSVVLGSSIAMIVLALSEGSAWGWRSHAILGLIGGGAFLLVALPFLESKIEEPILDLKLLLQRNVLVANFAILFANLGLFLAFQSIIFRLELPPPTGYGFDILTAGLYLVAILVGMFVTTIVSSTQISKIGAKPLMTLGSVLGFAGFLLLSTAKTPDELLYFSPVMACGLGLLFVSSQNTLVLSVDPRKMGLATSMNTVFRSLGSSLGSPIAGTLISTFTTWVLIGYSKGTPVFFSEASVAAFQYGFYIAAACFLAVLGCVFYAQEVLGKNAKAGPREMAAVG
jgi:predicted MFS family arabinose efflux permease